MVIEHLIPLCHVSCKSSPSFTMLTLLIILTITLHTFPFSLSLSLSTIKSMRSLYLVWMVDGLPHFFNSTIGCMQGSPILFGLYIDELKEMVVKFVKGVEEVAIVNVIFMLLLYVDDVVLFSKYQDA